MLAPQPQSHSVGLTTSTMEEQLLRTTGSPTISPPVITLSLQHMYSLGATQLEDSQRVGLTNSAFSPEIATATVSQATS
jgi:hypothetical protein